MKVYHGSYTEITEIDLSKCEKNKDFGQGFYVTKNRKHVEEWAERIGSRNHTLSVVTEFEFGKYLYLEKDFKTLHFSDYSAEWLDFAVSNRSNKTDEPVRDFYNSDIFTQLADETTNLYLKSWQEIYEMLKVELKKQ